MFSIDDAKRIGDQLNIDWNIINLNEFHMGLNVELEDIVVGILILMLLIVIQ